MTEPIFQAVNHHVPSCGRPPPEMLHGTGGLRFYGENAHGEQMIAEASTERLTFVMGDLSWESPIVIDQPDYPALLKETLARIERHLAGHRSFGVTTSSRFDAVMSLEEMLFLSAVLASRR